MSAGGWIENRLATSRIDGAVIRLCEPQGRRFAGQIRGCEPTHQVGLWTSEAHRPRGQFRYGASGAFVPIGRVSYVPADVEWEARFEDCGPVRPALYCDFEKDYFRALTGVDGADGTVPLAACLSVSGPVIVQALSLLLEEVRNPGFAHEVTVDALCRVVLVEVGRHFRQFDESATGAGTGKLARWQVDRIRDHVAGVEGRAIAIGEIAAICGLSGAHMRRVFKATMGVSIGTFIERIRFEKARVLLSESALPLKQVAHVLGFANPGAFSTAFRRSAGVSPSQFRQMSADAMSIGNKSARFA